MELTRETIRSGAIRRLIAREGGMPLLSHEALRASRRLLLDGADLSTGLWIFGYGSLIWNPAFHHVERRLGRVHGYHCRFCLWVQLGRGTPDNPGLMLGLERGGSCPGVALRIAPDAVESEAEVVWLREMLSGSYVPRWVTVRTEAGPVRAVAFTVNPDHPRYAGRLPEERVVRALATAAGDMGTSAEYLATTVAHLDILGVRESSLHDLHARVAAY